MRKQYDIPRAPLAAASVQIGPSTAPLCDASSVARERTRSNPSRFAHRRSRRAGSRVARRASHIARVVVVDAIRAEGGVGFD